MNSMIRWVRTALIVYILLALVSEVLNYLSSVPPLNAEIVGIIVIIFTSTQQIFNLVQCSGDIIFGYDSGFNIVSFILGAVVWAVAAIFLCYITRNKTSTKDKLHYSGKILMILDILLGVIGCIVAAIYFNFIGDFVILYLFVFLLVVLIPIFLIGLVLFIYSKFL